MNVLIVAAFFAAAWWPLQHLTGQTAAEAVPLSESGKPLADAENFTIRVLSSHPLETLSVAHLGQSLLTVGDPDAESEIERAIEGVEIPSEGIEFWVEASLASATGDNQRPAIQLELIPEVLEREPRKVTLWGQPGGTKIEAPAVFLWPDTSD